jgi:hypothetical protein
MTVALDITFGILSAMTHRFDHAKARIIVRSSLRASSQNTVRRRRQQPKRCTELEVETISSARRSKLLPDRLPYQD